MPRPWRTRRPVRPAKRQRLLPFLERATRLERRFKGAIVALTLLAAIGLAAAMPSAFGNAMLLLGEARKSIGVHATRAQRDAEWRRRRLADVERTSAAFREVYRESSPATRRLLQYAGMTPDDGVLRWGNYEWTLLLSSRIFAPDDSGRSYRMRPGTRGIWLRGVELSRGIVGFFLVPDAPGLDEAIAGTGAIVVPGSAQATNSWGCRGPEPDLDAPLRGLVLGDSNMLGMFVGDDEAPPAAIGRELERRLGLRASMLNTGHLGYSPEQMYFTLAEYADRFRPHFVLLTLCVNDFGVGHVVLDGKGDYIEGHHWLKRIRQFCEGRGILHAVAIVPPVYQVVGLRREGEFPGPIANICDVPGTRYINPIEDLIDASLRLRAEAAARGESRGTDPLYNGHLDDGHLSAKGTAAWGEAVGRRLALLLEQQGHGPIREGDPPSR